MSNALKRVAITGYGIVSSIGNNRAEVTRSLREGTSGIVAAPEYAELGFRSCVHGAVNIDTAALIDRKILRFMGDAAAYAYIALREALEQAQLTEAMIRSPRTGVVAGSGGGSNDNILAAVDILRSRGARKIGPYRVPRTMSSTVSANLATALGVRGVNYSLSSACATSTHCVGHAAELIQFGKQDIVFAGGGEELHWSMSVLFDAMGALSSHYNDDPPRASRPYDANRDGFVIAGGGAMLVLEEWDHARRRGANILAELVGYGATSDGSDMVQPSGEGAVRCMRQAMATTEGPVDYINTHGTSTPAGDICELQAIGEVFGNDIPALSSTKSLTGHSLGAVGASEAIYTLIMMQEGFISASANIIDRDPLSADYPIVETCREGVELRQAMTNSFGFGGTNATLVFRQPRD